MNLTRVFDMIVTMELPGVITVANTSSTEPHHIIPVQ